MSNYPPFDVDFYLFHKNTNILIGISQNGKALAKCKLNVLFFRIFGGFIFLGDGGKVRLD